MEKDLISVIVPVYNCERYLERCIESIIKQTYKNIEIILVNDGSTDNSGKICDLYAQKDSRVIVIHKENSGLPGARNVSIASARGKYIAFVDQDDFVKEDFVEILYDLVEANQADIAICAYDRGKANEFPVSHNKTEVRVENYTAEEMLKNWHGKYKHQETVAWNKLYRKEVFDKYNICYPDGWCCGEDVYTTHQIVAKATKIVITNEVLYYYFNNGSGIMSTISEEKVRVNVMAQKQRLQFFGENGYQEARKRMAIKLQKYYMLMYCRLPKQNNIQIKNELLERFRNEYKEICSMKSASRIERLLFWSFKYFYKVYECVFAVGMRLVKRKKV